MYDRIVTINNTYWPAYRKPGATLVDLRMFDPNDRSSEPRLVFRPEKLRELGIPDTLIEAAAKSDAHGFLLFDVCRRDHARLWTRRPVIRNETQNPQKLEVPHAK